MPILSYTKAQTKKIPFEYALKGADDASHRYLSIASDARDKMTLALEKSEASVVYRAVGEYLPHGLGLLTSVLQNPALISNAGNRLKFQWTSILSQKDSAINKKVEGSWYSSSNVHFEIAFCIYSLAFSNMNQASDIFDTINTNAMFDSKVKEMVEKLSLAASQFDFLTNTQIPAWVASSPDTKWPIEANPLVSEFLKEVCLGDSQGLILEKANLKGNAKSLCAKIASGAKEQYGKAKATLESNNLTKQVSDRFVDYVNINIHLYDALMYQYLAQDAFKNEKWGLAEACSTSCMKRLKNFPRLKTKYGKDLVKMIQKRYLPESKTICETCSKDNDQIYMEICPDEADIQTATPQILAQVGDYQMPPASFTGIGLKNPAACTIQ